MKSIKKMLLGIALLVIAAMAMRLWFAGSVVGTVAFFITLILGIIFVIDGFLSVDKE